MVFIARRWAKRRSYGPYYYLGWSEQGKIKWKYLGKLEKPSQEQIRILEETQSKLQKRTKRIEEILRKLKEEVRSNE